MMTIDWKALLNASAVPQEFLWVIAAFLFVSAALYAYLPRERRALKLALKIFAVSVGVMLVAEGMRQIGVPERSIFFSAPAPSG